MASLPKTLTRAILAITVVTSCVGCDQVTKQIATQALRGAPPRYYLANTVRLEYTLNPGGFLSLGTGLPPQLRFSVFIVLNTVLLSAVIYVLVTRPGMSLTKYMALLLLLAGGVGNLIDRVVQHGLVTDFLNLGIGPVRTGVFNVADVAIMLGAAILAVSYRPKPDSTESPGCSVAS